MESSAGTQVTRISVGELIQRTSVAIHMEMENLLLTMRARDPELRTKSLRAFVSKTLKKLAQLYAICRWVESKDIQAFFGQIYKLEQHVRNVELQLSEIQDRVFFLHSFMFWMRSRRMEIEIANEMIASGSYVGLPEAIFTCGRDPMPGENAVKSDAGEDRAGLIDELNTFIRCRIGLSDRLPPGITYAKISKGYLYMRRKNLYEVIVSLDGLSDEADWVVLKASLLVASSASEHFVGTYPQNQVERELLAVLRKHSNAARDPKAFTRAQDRAEALQAALEAMRSENEGNGDRGGSEVKVEETEHSGKKERNEAIAMDVDTEDKDKEGMQPTLDLTQIDAVCLHFALAAVQRFFFVQALDMSYNLWKGCLEADYTEAYDQCVCRVRFWCSKYSHQYQYELRIAQQRYDPEKVKDRSKNEPSANTCGLGLPLQGSLAALMLSNDVETGYVVVPVPHSEQVEELQLHRYYSSPEDSSSSSFSSSSSLRGGVSMGSLLNNVLWTLGSTRLQLLYARLLCSPCLGLNSSDRGSGGVVGNRERRVEVSQSASVVQLRVGGSVLDLTIDMRSGEYCVKYWHRHSSPGPGPGSKKNKRGRAENDTDVDVGSVRLARLSSSVRSGVDLFQEEINNLETQQSQRDVLLSDGVQGLAQRLSGGERARGTDSGSGSKVRPLDTAAGLLTCLYLADLEASLLLKGGARVHAGVWSGQALGACAAGPTDVLPISLVGPLLDTSSSSSSPLHYSEYCLARWSSSSGDSGCNGGNGGDGGPLPCFATAHPANQADISGTLRSLGAKQQQRGKPSSSGSRAAARWAEGVSAAQVAALRRVMHKAVSGEDEESPTDIYTSTGTDAELANIFSSGQSDVGLFLLMHATTSPSSEAGGAGGLLTDSEVRTLLVLCRFAPPSSTRVSASSSSSSSSSLSTITATTSGAGAGDQAFGKTSFKKTKKVRHLTSGQLAAQRAREEELTVKEDEEKQAALYSGSGSGGSSGGAYEPVVLRVAALSPAGADISLATLLPSYDLDAGVGASTAAIETLLAGCSVEINRLLEEWVRPAPSLGVPGQIIAPLPPVSMPAGADDGAISVQVAAEAPDTVAVTFRFMDGMPGGTALICCPWARAGADASAGEYRLAVKCFSYPAEPQAEAGKVEVSPPFFSLGLSLLSRRAATTISSSGATAPTASSLLEVVVSLCVDTYPLLRFAYLASMQASNDVAGARREALARTASASSSSSTLLGTDLRVEVPDPHSTISWTALKPLSLGLGVDGPLTTGAGNKSNPGEPQDLLFTSHRYTVEHTGLGSDLLGEHVGGVLRVSLSPSPPAVGGGAKNKSSSRKQASGGGGEEGSGLVISDGLPGLKNAAFSAEAVPVSCLQSVDSFRAFVDGLLQRQGV